MGSVEEINYIGSGRGKQKILLGFIVIVDVSSFLIAFCCFSSDIPQIHTLAVISSI